MKSTHDRWTGAEAGALKRLSTPYRIQQFLDRVKRFPLISGARAQRIERASPLMLGSSMMGSDPAGLCIPGFEKKTKFKIS